jgi:hypothetical protein
MHDRRSETLSNRYSRAARQLEGFLPDRWVLPHFEYVLTNRLQ